MLFRKPYDQGTPVKVPNGGRNGRVFSRCYFEFEAKDAAEAEIIANAFIAEDCFRRSAGPVVVAPAE